MIRPPDIPLPQRERQVAHVVDVETTVGTQIICLQELFNSTHFCVEKPPEYFAWAEPIPGPTIERMAAVARETGTAIVCPIFERAPDGRYYNSAAAMGPAGDVIGTYRKASIPRMDVARSSEPRGNEKFYFSLDNLGFPTFDTPFGVRTGILICYDRHFPEAARVLGLGGAEVVFVPTCTSRMTRYLRDLELRAHAIANGYYVCGVNHIGVDVGGSTRDHFGRSLVASPRGGILVQASDTDDVVVVADLNLGLIPPLRELWGFYRDPRPDLYGPVTEAPSARSLLPRAVPPPGVRYVGAGRSSAGDRPAPTHSYERSEESAASYDEVAADSSLRSERQTGSAARAVPAAPARCAQPRSARMSTLASLTRRVCHRHGA